MGGETCAAYSMLNSIVTIYLRAAVNVPEMIFYC